MCSGGRTAGTVAGKLGKVKARGKILEGKYLGIERWAGGRPANGRTTGMGGGKE